MSKRINIIARTNGVGLDNDATLLKRPLEKAGYKVTFSHCRSRSLWDKWFNKKPKYDINIFLERIFPVWFGTAKKNLLIPNQERYPHRHIKNLKRIDYVLCKTKHAKEIFSRYSKTKFISFTSKDLNIENHNPDYQQFFHLAGRSTLKGTETILELWKKHPEWPTLTLVQHKQNAPQTVPKNVQLITDYLSSEEITKLVNQHGIHLCPSLSEGWGHYIAEAMSCGAIVITTDAPPMNELVSEERGILIPYNKQEPRHLGTNFHVNPDLLEKEISKLVNTDNRLTNQKAVKAREWFHKNNNQFTTNIVTTINEIS